MLESLSHTHLDPNLKDVGYLTPGGKKSIGVSGEVMLVDTLGEEIDMSAIGAGGVGGGSIVYTNAAGDFTATPTVGAKTITITGLPFTLEDLSVVSGGIKLITSAGVVTNLPLTSVTVACGVITLADLDANFASGDKVLCTFIGPDKAYDLNLDSTLTVVQNPDYAHVTTPELVIDEADIMGAAATADAGGGATTIVDADGAFSVANIAVGYVVRNRTENVDATVNSVDSTTQITTGAGAADWSSDAYTLPLVKRYEINMDTYWSATIQYYLRNGASLNTYLQLWGTLSPSATVDADTSWINLSATYLGGATGINCGASASVEGLVSVNDYPGVQKLMLKLIVECDLASGADNDYEVYVKKLY